MRTNTAEVWLHRGVAPFAWLGFLALLSCAPAMQRVFEAASNETVTTRLEATYDGRGQYVVVENRSTQPVVVTSLNLRECENIKNRCGVTRMRLRVAAGETRRITTVQVADPNRAFNFRYGWTWEVDAQPTPLPK